MLVQRYFVWQKKWGIVKMNTHKRSRLALSPLDSLFTIPQMLVALLTIAVLGSAIAVVYIQHLNRSLHIQLQSLYEARDALHVEWSQLLLEQGTYGSDGRVEKVAQERLQMVMPKSDSIRVIRP